MHIPTGSRHPWQTSKHLFLYQSKQSSCSGLALLLESMAKWLKLALLTDSCHIALDKLHPHIAQTIELKLLSQAKALTAWKPYTTSKSKHLWGSARIGKVKIVQLTSQLSLRSMRQNTQPNKGHTRSGFATHAGQLAMDTGLCGLSANLVWSSGGVESSKGTVAHVCNHQGMRPKKNDKHHCICKHK